MNTRLSRLYAKAEELLGIDLRSLAVFRIGLGLLVLYDLAIRATDLTAHYTDAGVLPREVLYEVYPRVWYLSLHTLSGSAFFQAILFGVAALAAVTLVVGYRTRLATVLSWGLMLSLHVRNPAVLNSGDQLFLLLLFWGMFLPLGACWSVDRIQKGRVQARRILSVATMGLLLQVCFVYWFSVAWKSHPVWHEQASAVYFALSLDRFATEFGLWLLNSPTELLHMLTRGTWWFELIGPMLVFAPVYNGPVRTVIVFAFASFHIGLGLAMTLGIFPTVCIIAWLVFLPSWFWDVALPKLFSWLSIKQSRFGGGVSCIPRPALQSSFAANVVAVLVIWYVGMYNFHTLSGWGGGLNKYFQPVTVVGETLNINQTWRMFAPRPTVDDGWYIVAGELESGEKADVFRKHRLRWDRPKLISRTFKNQRWRKYMGRRMLEHEEVLGPLFAHYLWTRWNEQHKSKRKLRQLSVYLMYEKNLPGNEVTPVERRLVASIDSVSAARFSIAKLTSALD